MISLFSLVYYGYTIAEYSSGPLANAFEIVGSLGSAAAPLWPFLVVALRYALTRRLTSVTGLFMATALSLAFTQLYVTPLYTHWLGLRVDMETEGKDYGIGCFEKPFESMRFISHCLQTRVRLETWPIVIAHHTVIRELYTMVRDLLSSTLAYILYAVAAIVILGAVQNRTGRWLYERRLLKEHNKHKAGVEQTLGASWGNATTKQSKNVV